MMYVGSCGSVAGPTERSSQPARSFIEQLTDRQQLVSTCEITFDWGFRNSR